MIITCGSVERGTTVCDSDPLEKAVQHSLRAACTHFEADNENGQEVRVHMIDTPGYPDFVGQAWVLSTLLKQPPLWWTPPPAFSS